MELSELHTVGGGAKSPLWLQLKADICQVPLRVPQVTEAACLGAALLAGTASGIYPDLATAVASAVQFPRRVEPQPDMLAAYDRRFRVYRQLYPRLIELQRQI